jgi:hypothetical protein
MPNPINAGPAGDGSKSLAKESKAGLLVQFVLSVLGAGALAWLTSLDTSQWSGWWASTAVAAVATAAGLLAAWLKPNRG